MILICHVKKHEVDFSGCLSVSKYSHGKKAQSEACGRWLEWDEFALSNINMRY